VVNIDVSAGGKSSSACFNFYDLISFFGFSTDKTALRFPLPFTTSLFQFWLSPYDINSLFDVVILRGFHLPFAFASVIFYLAPF
jgi:hypothetical protein